MVEPLKYECYNKVNLCPKTQDFYGNKNTKASFNDKWMMPISIYCMFICFFMIIFYS